MAESDSDSSVEQFLKKSQFSFSKTDLVGTSSNISINIINYPNIPSTSTQPVVVQVDSDSINKKKTSKVNRVKPKAAKNDCKINKRVTDSTSDADKYNNLNPHQLNNIAARIEIFHQLGVVVNDNITSCKNKNKNKTKKLKTQNLQKTTKGKKNNSRKVNIGATCQSFGVKQCLCCNLDKDDLNQVTNFDQLETNEGNFSKAVEEKLSTDALNRLREREDQLVQLQQRQLLRHSEIGTASVAQSEVVEPYIPELSYSARERIQNFVNSIEPEKCSRVTQSDLNNSLQSRLDLSLEDCADSLHKKTILERIDFQKEQERRSRLLQNQFLNKDHVPITSTPNNLNRDDLPSCSNAHTDNDVLDISGIGRLEPDVEINGDIEQNNCDFSTLDRSNITIRGAKNTQNSVLVQSNKETSVDIVKKEENIMEYVNDLIALESQAIEDEVEERFQRLYESRRTACDVLSEAVNPTRDAFEEEMVLDNSIEVIDLCSSLPIIAESDEVIVLSNTDTDVEIVQVPSTSTGVQTRKRGKPNIYSTAKRRRQNNKKLQENLDVKEQPKLENKQSSSVLFRDCPICLEDITNKEISSTTCGHVFCTKCIKEVIKTSKLCPNCRTRLTLKKIHPLFL